MEKKYYFVIGAKNVVIAEAVKVLEEKGAAFCQLDPPYIFTRDEAVDLAMQGYTLVYLGVTYRSENTEYMQITDSPLYKVLQLTGSEFSITDRQYMAMDYYLGKFCFDWAANLRKLIAAGWSKEEIVRLQRQNREALGLGEEAEKTAQKAVDRALSGKKTDFLVIEWNYKNESTDFENWLPVLDRVFWIQNFVNVLIITPYNAAYYGYGRIAAQIGSCASLTSCSGGNLAQFLYPLAENDKCRAVDLLKTETALLRKNGLLW